MKGEEIRGRSKEYPKVAKRVRYDCAIVSNDCEDFGTSVRRRHDVATSSLTMILRQYLQNDVVDQIHLWLKENPPEASTPEP